MFGKRVQFTILNNHMMLKFEKAQGRIEVITPWIINVFSGVYTQEHHSRAIENLVIKPGQWSVTEASDHWNLQTECLSVKIYDDFKVDFYNLAGELLCQDYRKPRAPFYRRGVAGIAELEGHLESVQSQPLTTEVIKNMEGDEVFYGLGDKSGHLNKYGYGYEMWNTDDPSPHVESHKSLYKSVPFLITKRDVGSFGLFFDNTFKSTFDMGKENQGYYFFGAQKGNLDYYFLGGPALTDVITQYTYLTGTSPLPQMWTLGFQQSRWSYTPDSRVKEIAAQFREHSIPCDVIHLDIDYMDQYKVFTWHKENFKNPKKLIADLKTDGFKIVTIVDPGVKKEKGYEIYEEGLAKGYFATDKDGITYVNQVWPGDSVYPDFSDGATRTWWASNQQIMLDSGVAGIWNDMNEPASFNGPLPDDVQFKNDGRPTDHSEIHNVYGHLMSKATYDGLKQATGKRPFVITRGAYAGTQKYSTVWTGDNQSFWEHLRMSLPMLMNLGMCGMAFCGTDVGGFSFDASAELLSRWIQVGCFSPLFRNHSAMHTRDQEAWAFDEQTLAINRRYIQLRYKLLPYLYDLMWQTEQTGLPIMRPLVLHNEHDPEVFEMNDQFMFGEQIMVAPVVEQGKTSRVVYLPAGTWTDYWTKEVYTGNQHIVAKAPLDICPIYIKSGSIIPLYPVQNYVGEQKITTLTLDIYPADGVYTHYKDDQESYDYREGKYAQYQFTMKHNAQTLKEGIGAVVILDIITDQYKGYEAFELQMHHLKATQALWNGKAISFVNHNQMTVITLPAQQGILTVKI